MKKSLMWMMFMLAILMGGTARAATLTWDTVTGDAEFITEGAGTWSTGGGNWNDGVTDAIWASASDAIFGGAYDGVAGLVTIASGGFSV